MGYRELEFEKGTLFCVTGGAGFIGSALCETLIDMGMRVRCVDNLSTGFMKNIEPLVDNKNFEFISGDIRDADICKKACDQAQYVLHQAALGSVPRSIKMPELYSDNNITGTVNMMEAAKNAGVKRFVYASSSSVYGDSKTLPKKEGQEGNILSPYALTKKADEEWAKLYYNLYGLETVGLRYFNVFGRRQNPDGEYAAVIPKFIKAMLEGKRPTINGDGLSSRDFTYIENVIEANLRSCVCRDGAGQAFNIACGARVTLLEMLSEIEKALGKHTEPIFDKERPCDIRHSHADISRAKAALGYDPDYNFVRGIHEAIEWYKQNL